MDLIWTSNIYILTLFKQVDPIEIDLFCTGGLVQSRGVLFVKVFTQLGLLISGHLSPPSTGPTICCVKFSSSAGSSAGIPPVSRDFFRYPSSELCLFFFLIKCTKYSNFSFKHVMQSNFLFI